MNSKAAKLAATKKLDDVFQDPRAADVETTYRPVPYPDVAGAGGSRPVWRVRFELAYDPTVLFGLDINGEVVLGRGEDASGFVALNDLAAEELGVSRRHAMLRPTDTKLFIIDLGSTNGTWQNGHSIGVNMPYSVSNGDLVRLGELEFVVRVIKRPPGHTAALRAKTDLADALSQTAKAITSQLNREDALNQALDLTSSLVSADAAVIWLVDQQTGDIYLEGFLDAEHGEARQERLAVADSTVSEVIETGKPVQISHDPDDNQIVPGTTIPIDIGLFVPLTLGGATLGALMAGRQAEGGALNPDEERILSAIADFTAIAVQNGRMYEATDNDLTRHTKVLTALNYALTNDMKNTLNAILGYAGLLEGHNALDEEAAEIAAYILAAGNDLSQLANDLTKLTTFHQPRHVNRVPDVPADGEATIIQRPTVDLVEVITRVLAELKETADSQSIALNFRQGGSPFIILGDSSRLYQSVYTLIENAIKYSPDGTEVTASLVFSDNAILIQVNDAGPGIPEAKVGHIFEKFSRGSTPTEGEAGLELGLAMVWSAAEAHRGTVTARNGEAGGAEFTITLPANLRFG